MVSSHYNTKTKQWFPAPDEKNDALRDPFNKFLHTVFTIKDGRNERQLVLSDVRKFAKVTLLSTDAIDEALEIGPEPLTKEFTLELCTAQLLKRPMRAIKEVLLDQKIISGIGNIYSDEALWLAGIHPLRLVQTITKPEFKKQYESIKTVLEKGVDFGATQLLIIATSTANAASSKLSTMPIA